ncbi:MULTISPECIES: SusC/RagA family TonB-linked outer membrane protein [Chitinophagaceae]
MGPQKTRSHLRVWKYLLALAIFFVTATTAQAQKVVTGRVVDSTTSKPLSSISVQVKGTNVIAITDDQGNFSINVPPNGTTLDISGPSYLNQSIDISGRTDAGVILLREQVTQLEQVVVIGYSSVKKKDITGSVTVVNTSELKEQPASSPVEALQGKATGVQIVNDGSPGSTPQIRIRGNTSIYNNDPLFVIDGMPYQGKLSWLSSDDIESMQVLKDASAASIYGSRANNGVVIITTKIGRKGSPKISLNVYNGTQAPMSDRFPKYLNPQQFAQYVWDQYSNAGVPIAGSTMADYYGSGATPTLPDYLLAGTAVGQNVTSAEADPSNYNYSPTNSTTFYQITKANKGGTNWFKEITHNAPIQNYELSILGGGDNANYAISGGMYDQQGTIKYTSFKRYYIRANSNFTALGGALKLGENAQYSYTRGIGFATNPNVAGSYAGEGSPVGWAYRIQTIVPVYDIMGNFAGTRGSGLGNADNPLAILYRGKDNYANDNQFFGSVYADLKIVKGLNLKTTFGTTYDNYAGVSIGYPDPERSEASFVNSLSEYQGWVTQWTWTNTLTYHQRWDKHDFTVMGGTEAIKATGRALTGGGNSFALFGDINYYYLSTATASLTSSSNVPTGYNNTLASLFAKADYAFDDKYILSATIRRDGSSNFGPNHRYGTFPAASAAWRVSKENFMNNVFWVNDLKLRVGYGATGNQGIPWFQFLKTYQQAVGTSSYPIGGSALSSGIWTNSYDNPDIKWEALKSWNIGLDFTLFSNKIDGSFDWYNKKTTDMLYPVPLLSQAVGGGASPYVNIGSMSNKGVEFSLNYHYNADAINKDAFKFDLGASISRNVNKVLALAPTVTNQLYGGNRNVTSSILAPGQPFGEFYGYKVIGINQSASDITNSAEYSGARVGGFKYQDVNKDGTITPDDRTYLGSPYPAFIYSLSFNSSWHRFDVSMFFNASYGNKIFDETRYYTDLNGFYGAVSSRLLNAWSPTNTKSMVPSPYYNAPLLENASNSYYVQPGSYFRMKLLQIGYNFVIPKSFKERISGIKLYVSGTNLFTITKYSGLDPEVSQFASTFSAPGVDLGMYPSSRQYLVGLNVTF